MKMNRILMLGFFAAAVGLVGCTDEDLNTPDYSKPAGNQIVLDCSSSWGAGNETIWATDSELGFYCSQLSEKNLRVGVANPSVGEPQGLFYTRKEWAEGEHTFYIYAPYNKNNTTTTIAGNLSDVQKQNGMTTDHVSANSFVYGKFVGEPQQTPVKVALSSVFGYLDFAVSTASKYEGWNVKSINISNKFDITLCGKYSVDMTTGATSFTSGVSAMTLNVAAGPSLSAVPFHAYGVVAAAALHNVACDIEVVIQKENKDDLVLLGTHTPPADIAAQLTTTIALNLDDMEEEEVEDTSINLSQNGTANCYIAAVPGQVYRFKATVMGNGFTTPATPDYASTKGATANGITPTAMAPKSAQIMWQTAKSLISDVKLKNGYIYFTVNGSASAGLTVGNAVVATYDGASGAGNIVWSWHIWVTASPLEADAQTYTLYQTYQDYTNYASPVLMDRNLGATATGIWEDGVLNNSHGLKYQWGRKDPFPSSDNSALASIVAYKTYDKDDNEISVMSAGTGLSGAVAWKAVPNTVSGISPTAMAQYPMNFVTSSADWLPSQVDDLWGNPVYPLESNNIGHKSIYDPCPVGWRVPHRYAYTGFTKTGENDKAAIGVNWNMVDNVGANLKTKGGFKFYYSGTAPTPYPANGMLNSSTGALFRVGNYAGSYWSSSANALTGVEAAALSFDYGNVNVSKGIHRAYGYGVRCMKER